MSTPNAYHLSQMQRLVGIINLPVHSDSYTFNDFSLFCTFFVCSDRVSQRLRRLVRNKIDLVRYFIHLIPRASHTNQKNTSTVYKKLKERIRRIASALKCEMCLWFIRESNVRNKWLVLIYLSIHSIYICNFHIRFLVFLNFPSLFSLIHILSCSYSISSMFGMSHPNSFPTRSWKLI